VNYHGHVCKERGMSTSHSSSAIGPESQGIVAEIFKKAGWRVRRHPTAGEMRADLLVDGGDNKYVIQVKGLSEGRSDRLLPLLSQAILQAQAMARRLPESAAPLAIVVARRIPDSVVDHLTRFAEQYAPDVGIGIVDLEGLRAFAGAGLEKLNARPLRRVPKGIGTVQGLPDLFSDLNQWMLKILLGQRLPEGLINVPRQRIRNASKLATVAHVSVMSAARFVTQLAKQGFLDDTADGLQLVRVEELLERWISASRHAAKEVPARWIIKRGPKQIFSAVREYSSFPEVRVASRGERRIASVHKVRPRCCVGLFSAADALGFSLVHGAPPHIYLERLTSDALQHLGANIEESNRPADLYIRVPVNRESIFRACVSVEHVQMTDILQVWLDVSTHPARGREQALEIHRRILKPLAGIGP
jgi:hypothetical protein